MSPPLPPQDFRAWLNGSLPSRTGPQAQSDSILANTLASTARFAIVK
jgi:hypothetical protein